MRQFIEGIWFIVRTGCQWRLLPDDYGCWYSIFIADLRDGLIKVYEML
jgi:transposase